MLWGWPLAGGYLLIISKRETGMIAKITRIYTRRSADNGQVTTYVEWVDRRGRTGRTEGSAFSDHMRALISRGEREGVIPTREDA